MACAFPIAANADAALHAAAAWAVREREARGLAGAPVVFVSAFVGPAFTTREAALEAYAARLADLNAAAGDEGWWSLQPVAPEGARPRAPVRPANRDGVRWPPPPPSGPVALWRLSISFWRIEDEAPPAALPAARHARRDPSAEGLDARALERLAAQPLRALRPQQPLDVGLFEVRLPEDPSRRIPDE